MEYDNKEPKVMHIISHTHWDREWYLPFQGFRMKLVDLIDNLLDILEQNPSYRAFHLDGQTIVLEDYLEIRPENEGRLRKFIADGRIIIGPWYCQPDEFLPSGESLIRNLLLGYEISARFGAEPLKAGYVVDLFGHNSQLPQILNGFGIKHALLFRGVYRDQVPSEFLWNSPDGSSILTFHLHDDFAYSTFWYNQHCGKPSDAGRYFGGNRPPKKLKEQKEPDPFDPELSYERLQWLKDELSASSATRHLLFMDGIDHIEANPHIPALIRDMNARMPESEGRLVHSTLPEYFAKVDSSIDAKALKNLTGELRWPNKDGNLNAVLAGVLSSRVNLKQDNDRCQRLLERWAEPFAVFASLSCPDYKYPTAFLARSWRHLLDNHPHDSICGCSIDQVHKDMVFRFDQSRLISEGCLTRSLKSIAEEIYGGSKNDGDSYLVLFNARQRPSRSTEIVEFDLNTSRFPANFDLFDEDGSEVSYQVLNSEHTVMHELWGHDVPWFPGGIKMRIAIDPASVPGFGYKSLSLRVRKKIKRLTGSIASGTASLENEFLIVNVNPNGTLKITDKGTNQIYDNCNAFEDRGDVGNGWNWMPPEFDEIFYSTGCRASVSLVDRGPLVGSLKINVDMPVPSSASPDNRRRESATSEILKISSMVCLRKGSRMVEIKTTVDNSAKDHRLRALIPTGMRVETFSTDTQFDMVARTVELPDTSGWREVYPPTAPIEEVVCTESSDCSGRTVSVVSRELREVEVTEGPESVIALTLLRGFRAAVATTGNPGGQCLGTHVFHYAICPSKGTWQESGILEEAEVHNLPLTALVQEPSAEGALPRTYSWLGLKSDGPLEFSALKQSEDGSGYLLRFYNPDASSHTACFELEPMDKAYVCRIDETDRRPVLVEDGGFGKSSMKLNISPKSISNILLQPQQNNG